MRRAVAHLAFAADGGADALHLVDHRLVARGDAVEGEDDLGHQRIAVRRQPDVEVAVLDVAQPIEQGAQGRLAVVVLPVETVASA